MIQRIQSFYLVLSSLCLAAMYYFSMAKIDDRIDFKIYGLWENDTKINLTPWDDLPFSIIGAALIMFNFVIIFLFKNRKTQLILGRLQYFLILGFVVLLYITLNKTIEHLGLDETSIAHWGGIYLPIAALVFNFLSNRAIKKDEELVNSLDRLR